MKKMKIATMVTGHFTTPPPQGVIYAPMDIAVSVSEGLQKLGHEVTFFGPEGTKLNVHKVASAGLQPLKHGGGLPILGGKDLGGAEVNKIFNLWDQFLIAKMYQEALAGKFDILHIHPIDRALPFGLAITNVPVVYTLHDPIFKWRAEIFKMFSSSNQYLVSISDAQRKPSPDLNYIDTIYNGIDLTKFPYSEQSDDYLLFVGRTTKSKGVAEAVQAALKSDNNLVIAGPGGGNYWDENIKPYLGSQIRHVGLVSRNELFNYYQKAKATLVPIQWEEPFGLVITESMACGTPVIAFNRGSVPEIIIDGKNGYIVNDIAEMADAIKRIYVISRAECRKSVEEKFSSEKMVKGYEKAFGKILGL